MFSPKSPSTNENMFNMSSHTQDNKVNQSTMLSSNHDGGMKVPTTTVTETSDERFLADVAREEATHRRRTRMVFKVAKNARRIARVLDGPNSSVFDDYNDHDDNDDADNLSVNSDDNTFSDSSSAHSEHTNDEEHHDDRDQEHGTYGQSRGDERIQSELKSDTKAFFNHRMVQGRTTATTTTASHSEATPKPAQQISSPPTSDIKSCKSETPKHDALAPTALAPFGYKLVKVKKPDGRIVQVKRPLTAEEAEHAVAPQATAYAHETAPRDIKSPVSISYATGDDISAPARSSPVTAGDAALAEKKSIKPAVQVTTKEVSPERDVEKTQETPRPRSLVRRSSQIMQIVTWIVMLVFPALFLALGIATAVLNGHIASGYLYDSSDDALSQAVQVAVSLWPIVFAAIVAQTFRACAAYKVERGVRLLTLEQLTGSNSLASAIKQPFLLRTLNLTSIALLAIWCFSPLAGQAVLRMSYTETFPNPQTRDVATFNYVWAANNQSCDLANWPDPLVRDELISIYSTLLTGSQYTRENALDIFGNVKVPIYNASGVAPNSSDWYNLPLQHRNTGISPTSLVGLPLWAYSNHGDDDYDDESDIPARLLVQSVYFVLDCDSRVTLDGHSDTAKSLFPNLNNYTSFFVSIGESGSNSIIVDKDAYDSHGVINFASRDWTKDNEFNLTVADGDTDMSPSNVTGEDPMIFQYYKCKFTQVVVMNEIDCTGTGNQTVCVMIAQQPILHPKPQDYGIMHSELAAVLGSTASNYTDSDPVTTVIEASLTEAYLQQPDFSMDIKSVGDPTEGHGVNISAADMNQRFAVVLNTMWLLGTRVQFFTGELGDPAALDEDFDTNYVQKVAAYYDGELFKRYQVNWVWWAVLMVCATVLLLAATMAVWFEHNTIGPDFLGFASPSLKKNVKMTASMNKLSARDRLEALQECEVMLQDVRPENPEMGKIALSIKEPSSHPLVAGRAYR